MEALVTVETILLILLAFLVAGLLRSHAEILRRLEAPEPAAPSVGPSDDLLAPARTITTPAFDVSGRTLAGDAVAISVTGVPQNTLLAFLSSGCLSCQAFWDGLRTGRPSMPGDARIVVVTKDPSHESPSKLRDLAPVSVPFVMSSAAWEDYGVQGSPYFIYVDGGSEAVIGEGTATGWNQVASLIQDAFADVELAHGGSTLPPQELPLVATPRMPAGAQRAGRAEAELRAAGIVPGHPSLYERTDDPSSLPVGGPNGSV